MKILLLFISLFISNYIQAQMELELVFDKRQEQLIKENNIKEKIEYQKIGINSTDIRHHYYSKEGALDSIKQVGLMWCTPISMNSSGEIDKDWKMIYYQYENNIININNTEFKTISSNKNLELFEIESEYSKASYVIDTLQLNNHRSITKFDNDNNIYSHCYIRPDGKTTLSTILRYDEDLNLLSKIRYTLPREKNGSMGELNDTKVTYYYYNSKNQRIKEIQEEIGKEGRMLIEYDYFKNGLLKNRKTNNNEYYFEYESY